VLEEEATAREKTLKEASERIATLENTLKDMQRLLELKGAAVPPPPAVTPPAPSATEPSPPAPTPPAEPAPPEAAKADVPPAAAPPTAEAKPESAPAPAPQPEAKPADSPPPAAMSWWEDPALLGAALAGLGVLAGIGVLLARRRRTSVETDTFGTEPTVRAPAMPPAIATAAAVAAPDRTAEVAPAAAVAAAAAPADDVDPIQEADVYIAYGRDAQAEEILKEALAKNPGRHEIKLKLLEIYAARRSKNDFNALAGDLHEATQGRGELWLKAATMGFALDPDNALYAAGKDSAILPQVGVSTDVNLDFDLDMVTAAGAPTTVTDVPLDAGHEQTVKTMALSPERMEALRAEGAAGAAARSSTDTQPIVPDIDVSAVQPAPQTDVTLAPMRAGPITDINLEVPQSAAASNVIDFEFDPSKTVRIEPEAAAAFAHDQTVIISPENQEQARDLGLEIDLSALDAPPPTKPQDAPAQPENLRAGEISFDFELPPESPPTAEMEVPPTDVKLDVPEPKTIPAGARDFALDTVSLDLGSLEKTEVPAAPVHDDHWYDVQTKFDLAKAYQEMGDKDGAREILAEVIREGDAQQKAEADELMGKLG
jgi:pilus assembly protein FimV